MHDDTTAVTTTDRSAPNARNLAVYRDRAVANGYAPDGWLCAGERVTIHGLAHETRGEPLLDIGVGGGRTISLLSLLTDDYVAVDYSPEMVEVARSRYPEVDVRVGDARDLSDFPDGRFGSVVFSFNGIDSIDHDDRPRVLAEMHRVLRDGGLLAYSTLNMDGPQFRAGPLRDLTVPSWATARSQGAGPTAVQLAILAARLVRRVQALPDWRAVRKLERTHETWGLSTLEAHRYRLLNHFITVPAAASEVQAAGFELIDMVGWGGEPIDPAQRYLAGNSVFVLARKSTR